MVKFSARLVTWRYNNFGQPLETVDENGVRTTFGYHPASLPNGSHRTNFIVDPITQTGWPAQVTRDASPADSRRSSSLGDPNPFSETTYYDARGLVLEVDDAFGRASFTTFNELGQLVYRKERDGHEEQFWIGDNDFVVKRTEMANDLNFPTDIPSKSKLLTHEYNYDRMGNRPRIVS